MAGRSWEPFFVRRSDPASVPGIAALWLAGRGRGCLLRRMEQTERRDESKSDGFL